MITAIIILGITSILVGIILYVGSKYFSVHKDERYVLILENLPQANCGGCGYTGCAGLAAAITSGENTFSKCTVLGNEGAKTVSEKLGYKFEENKSKTTAVLLCSGGERCIDRYIYHGIEDCVMASSVGGSCKTCRYGCVGCGNCVRSCPFDAMKMGDDKLPHIDREKCVSCGICVDTCPLHLLEIHDISKGVVVLCSSHDKGGETKRSCTAGCIGCKICEKLCETNAIIVTDFVARVDREKCTDCNKCIEACPSKVIVSDHIIAR